MTDHYYSASEDNENWTHHDLNDAVEEYIDCNYGHIAVGDTITVYKADADKHKASDFLPGNIGELMSDVAYDNVGECVQSWLGEITAIRSLQEAVKKAVDQWADENKEQPKFCSLKNIRPIEIKISALTENSSEWHVVSREDV